MKRKDLLFKLEAVKGALASKDIVEALTYFYFSGTHVISYNDKVSISYPFKTDFSMFVKANDILRVVSKSTSENISLTEKGDKLLIKASNLNVNLATIEDDEVHARIEAVKKSLVKAKFTELPEDICEALLLCSHTASTNESDGTLTCCYIKDKDCMSTDNARIAHSKLSQSMPEMFIKASEIKTLVNMKPTSYVITKAWYHFKNDDSCIFSIRKIDGEFPPILDHFKFSGAKVRLPSNIAEGVDIASIFISDITPSVKISISKGFVIAEISSDAGKIRHRSKIKYKGDDIQFQINPGFLKDMMNHSTDLVIAEDRLKLETDTFSFATALYS